MLTRSEITTLLKAWSAGDTTALERLAEQVYPELRRIARRYLRSERENHTLQPTALVNEVYLRLLDTNDLQLNERAQFFALASQMMRRVLVDSARARNTGKRGALSPKVSIEDGVIPNTSRDQILIALDDALSDFSRVAPRPAKVVELRYFGGLAEAEIVEILGVSPRTVRRDWDFARAWLAHELNR